MVLSNCVHSQLLDFGLLQAFRLGTTILEPDFHLLRENVFNELLTLHTIARIFFNVTTIITCVSVR